MNQQYYIDLEKYSLQKFKENLQRRDMIPSRVILKDNIDERFKILCANGIENLKDLIGELKNKDKIEEFSNKANLSVEYLTILKREASSYLPNPIQLRKMPGVDVATVSALEKIGLKNTKHFFNEASNSDKINQISHLSGVSVTKLNELSSLSDLARLYGVGPVFARIIYDVGISSVNDFVKYSAEDFIEIYENKTQKKADFGISEINFSIELAKELINS